MIKDWILWISKMLNSSLELEVPRYFIPIRTISISCRSFLKTYSKIPYHLILKSVFRTSSMLLFSFCTSRLLFLYFL